MAREQWNSQFGFLLAAVGSAIGLGNIWRFSYMAYSHGGGAFLIPYIVALLTAGIPLLILEFGVGHERIGSAPLAFAKIGRNWEWLGWWSVLFVMFGIELYYSTVIAWCFNFFTYSFTFAWGDDPNAFFFGEYLNLSDGPGDLGGIRAPIFGALILVWALNWFILYRGIQRGIELANKIFMPLLLVLTTILVLWSLTLEGAGLGIKAYLTPDFSKLMSVDVWIDAYSQIFFTLSLGFGIMIAYASYLPEKTDITRSALLTGFINSGYSLFAGFAVFAVLGFMATAEGTGIEDVVTQSIGLAFVAYPKALSMMPGGQAFGAIFFLSLFVAGMSSSISILEAFTSALIDKFDFPRKRVANLLCLAGFLGSIVFATRGGLFWLDIVDHFVLHYGLVVVGIFECLLIGWMFKTSTLSKHINKYAGIKLGPLWSNAIKYFIPVVLGIIVVLDIIGDIKTPYGGYSWSAVLFLGVNWLAITLAAAVVLARRPWRNSKLEGSSRSD
jgi:NSS family neurotransmitter:Na+ symporter